jgi:hypothetical protein
LADQDFAESILEQTMKRNREGIIMACVPIKREKSRYSSASESSYNQACPGNAVKNENISNFSSTPQPSGNKENTYSQASVLAQYSDASTNHYMELAPDSPSTAIQTAESTVKTQPSVGSTVKTQPSVGKPVRRLIIHNRAIADLSGGWKPPPTSGYYGVYARQKRWQARIIKGSKRCSLGVFDTKEEAAFAYDEEARKNLAGGKTPLNYKPSLAAAEGAAAKASAAYKLGHPPQPKPRPPSGFYGVNANEKRWKAQVRYNSKDHYIGSFDTKQEAALAYDKEARQCGEEKPLNYESIKAAEEAAAKAQAEHKLTHPTQPKPRPPSGFYGVSANKERWKAQVRYDSKRHHLGTFDTKQEAALAYDKEARQCGEDKPLNYESIAAAEERGSSTSTSRARAHTSKPGGSPNLETPNIDLDKTEAARSSACAARTRRSRAPLPGIFELRRPQDRCLCG